MATPWRRPTIPISTATRRISSRSRRCRSWPARPRSIRIRPRSSTARGRGPIGNFIRARRQLASALAKRGIKRGDTVAAVLANTPAMLEAHYGVAMAGAVLNTINTRLDAAIIAFTLDHGEAKVLIVDREFSKVVKDGAGGLQGAAAGDRLRRSGIYRRRRTARQSRLRGFSARRRCRFCLADAGRRMGRHLAQLHLGHHRRSQGRRLSPSRRLSAGAGQRHHLRHGQASGLSVDAADVPLQRLVLSLDAVGGCRYSCLPARGSRGADLRRHRRPQGHASVRRADRDVDAAQRAGARDESRCRMSSNSSPPPRRRRNPCSRR